MEQVDQHILDACKQLDCSFVGEDKSLSNFSTEDTVEFLIRCIWAISPASTDDIPSCRLPPSISARFKLASLITEKLQDVKIAGGYGYQTLLYGNVTDLRKIFLDVIEKLPRHQDGDVGRHQDDSILSLAALYAENNDLWVPEFCRRLKMRHDGRFWCPGENDGDVFPLSKFKGDIWSVVEDVESRSWIAGLIRSDEGLLNFIPQKEIAGKPFLPPKPALPPKPSKLAADGERQFHAMAEKRTKLSKILENLALKRSAIIKTQLKAKQHDNQISVLATAPKKEHLKTLLNDPVDMKNRILEQLASADSRVADLEQQFAAVREAKILELQSLRETKGFAGKIDGIRKNISAIKGENNQLGEQRDYSVVLKEKLTSRIAKMGNENVNRDSITKRIFEMTLSLKKQKEELDKVLQENSAIQKEMNWISQSLYRAFNIIEETLYRDTEGYKGEQAYRLFGRTNLKCNSSMELIEKNGALSRHVEHVTDQIEIERQKNYSSQLERILRDLDSVEQENRSLEAKLKPLVS